MSIYGDVTKNNNWMVFLFGSWRNRSDLALQMCLSYLTSNNHSPSSTITWKQMWTSVGLL